MARGGGKTEGCSEAARGRKKQFLKWNLDTETRSTPETRAAPELPLSVRAFTVLSCSGYVDLL